MTASKNLSHLIVLSACQKDPSLLRAHKKKMEVSLHAIDGAKLGSTKKLHIMETTYGPSTEEDITKDFQSMISFCKGQGIIGANLKKRLNLIRQKRNDVHLQLRTATSRTYTLAHINQLGDTIGKLIAIHIAQNA